MDFIVGVFGQIGVDQSLIQRQLSAVVGHLEHIVLGGVYISRANLLGAVGKVSHHLLLLGAWRQRHIDGLAAHQFRHRQVEHIRRLHICHLFEHTHQFRQIIEFGESRFCAVAGTFRCKLHSCHGFPKGGCPRIKGGKPVLLQGFPLQIPLHREQLRHRVADGRTRGKHHAAAAGNFVKVAAFHIQITGALAFGLGYARHIAHFGKHRKVLEGVGFVHHQAVHAKLFKGYHIVLAGLVVELIQLFLQLLTHTLHLFDGEVLGAFFFQLCHLVDHIVDLALQVFDLPFL